MRWMFLSIVLISLPAWARPTLDDSAALVERAKRAIRYDLKDPDSAKFREVRVTVQRPKLGVVCGEINAKNSYAAYVGYRRFYYIEGDGEPAAVMEGRGRTGFPFIWDSYCR